MLAVSSIKMTLFHWHNGVGSQTVIYERLLRCYAGGFCKMFVRVHDTNFKYIGMCVCVFLCVCVHNSVIFYTFQNRCCKLILQPPLSLSLSSVCRYYMLYTYTHTRNARIATTEHVELGFYCQNVKDKYCNNFACVSFIRIEFMKRTLTNDYCS